MKKRKKIGELLVNAGIISSRQLEEAVKLQKEQGIKMGEALVQLGYVTNKQITNILAVQLDIPVVDLDREQIKMTAIKSIPQTVAKKYSVIPVHMDEKKIIIASANPYNMEAVEDIGFITKKRVKIHLCDYETIQKNIDRYYKEESEKALEDLRKEMGSANDIIDEEIEKDDIINAPTVRLVNSIIQQAIKMKASDIHIEPFENEIFVRARVDGILTRMMSIPNKSYSAICTRFKILADMNIAEKRVPQDGRIQTELDGNKYDLRVSSLPTVFGEKLVLRILHRSANLLEVSALGFTEQEEKTIREFMHAPHGIILVSGPTGSGKTTTLYAVLSELNTVSKNLVTVEDPVEYMFEGINQVQVNIKAGLTFAEGLRSILRQDPDIIMIGEIRDEETVEIAVRSAITGHLVLSTVHTNDAASTVTRLMDMGIEPYLVADSLVGVVAQRLVRRLCPECKEACLSSDYDKSILHIEENATIYKPKGCGSCGYTGYAGRLAVHEVLVVDDKIKKYIVDGESTRFIKEEARKAGMETIYDQCKKKVLDGNTSIEEMIKTVFV